MVEIEVTGEFLAWYRDLDENDSEAVARVVGLLEQRGVSLRFPYSSDVEGSRIALRELRIQSQGRPLRVLYKFDPKRQAVLLVGGDKTGDDRFYERMVPIAEQLWADYLEETGMKEKPG